MKKLPLTNQKQKIASLIIDLCFIGLVYVIFFVFNLELLFKIIFTALTIFLMIMNTWIMFTSKLLFDYKNKQIIYYMITKNYINFCSIYSYQIHSLSDKQHNYFTIALYDKNEEIVQIIKTFLSEDNIIKKIEDEINNIIENNI